MGESAHYVELSGCRSVAEVQQLLRRHAENNADLPWVIGTGWDQNLWAPVKPLTRLDLDAALPDGRPCLLYRRCWHAAVVNTAALRAADIDPNKPWSPGNDPPSAGGVGAEGVQEEKAGASEGVEVDDAGRPTGLFREGSMRLVETAITAASFEIRCDQFAEALERCVRSGLTAVHSNDENAIQVYARLQEEGRLPVRVYLTLPHEELDKDNPLADTSGGGGRKESAGGVRDDRPTPWSGNGGLVSWNRVKLFSDGSLGAETAAMRLPYLGTDNNGVLIHEQEALTRKVAQARDRGFRVEVHAIGDRALEAVLDAFEGAGLQPKDRPIVTHCQVAGPDLVTRMGKLGAVAAVQPSFVPSDADVVIKRLSPSMHANCYPWRSLLSGGVTCAGSSDAPIETHNPFRGMYDAVLRPDKPPSSPVHEGGAKTHPSSGDGDDVANDETGNSGGGSGSGVTAFMPDECLTLEEAVWMYTAAGAFAAGAEARLGAIRPGFLADLTVVEVEGGCESLLKDPSLLLEAKVSQVWVGGRCRWNNDSTADENNDRSEKGEANKGSSLQDLSSPSPLRGSGLPGKNGPKRKRPRPASGRSGNNPWLSGGIGRMGRCRCCS
ncbi:unnamed protein product [Ectocarpus fasciculatus]